MVPLHLLLVVAPVIWGMTNSLEHQARNFLRHSRVPLPQAVRLDAESFVEVVGPPIIQESATVEVYFHAKKVVFFTFAHSF